MRLLTATPTVKLGPDTLHAIFGQTYQGWNDHLFTFENSQQPPAMNIIYNYQKIRAAFLAGGYDALWIVEDDIIPPPDALEKLLAVEADLVYGVYCFRRGVPLVNILQPRTHEPMTYLGPAWARQLAAGAVVECGGLGFGCTLIRRPVLERFEMRTVIGGGDVDSCLMEDAEKAGFRLKAHLGVVCGHRDSLTSVLWPVVRRPYWERVGIKTPRTAQVRVLRPVALFEESTGQRVAYPGDVITVEDELAGSLIAIGALERAA